MFGRVFHELIEARAKGKSTNTVYRKYQKEVQGLMQGERDMYLTTLDEAADLFDAYEQYWEHQPLTYVQAEGEVDLELTEGVWLNGYLDGVVRAKDGGLWLIEHKTGNQINAKDGDRMRDLQSALYAAALIRSQGLKLEGVLWDYVTSKPLVKPEVLKSGKLSMRASAWTTPQLFEETAEEQGIELGEEYQAYLDTLAEEQSRFFKRVYVPINESVVDTLVAETIQTARELTDQQTKDKTRNITRDCGWCDFEPLCHAELFNLDMDMIIKHHYRRKEDGDQKQNSRKGSTKGKSKTQDQGKRAPRSRAKRAVPKRRTQ